MTTWAEAVSVGLTLPEAVLTEAHEGSPALAARGRQFARLRASDDGEEVLQFWVADHELVQTYVDEDPACFRGAAGYSNKVVMARLELLETETVRELIEESWRARVPVSLRRSHPDLA